MEPVDMMLGRNNACHQCRKRKLRCSGTRPVCAHCLRRQTKKAHLGPTRALDCTWDEIRKLPSGPKKGAYADQAAHSHQGGINVSSTAWIDSLSTGSESREAFGYPDGIEGYSILDSGPAPESGEAVWSGMELQMESMGVGTAAAGHSAGAITRSDWPMELPNIDIISHVLDIFFDAVPTYPKMLRKSALKHGLSFPPSHWRFPAQPLLHAILCVTAPYLPPSCMSSREYWPTGTPLYAANHPQSDDEIGFSKSMGSNSLNQRGALHLNGRTSLQAGSSPLLRFQIWHRRQALEYATLWSDQGKAYMQLLQAMILVTASDQMNAWWDDVWALSGQCMRFAMPLRIHESAQADHSLTGFADGGCPDVSDPLMLAEMTRTWWMAYLIERSASMWTTWPSSLPDDEITCELPALQSTYDRGFGDLIGTQTITDADLHINHPPLHQDSLCLLVKAVKLFVDCRKFIRVYQRRPHTILRYASESNFHLLLAQITSFRLSLPLSLRNPVGGTAAGSSVDADAMMVLLLTHAAVIVLGEPFLTAELAHHETAKLVLASIRSILTCIYDVTATSYELSRLPASFSYVVFFAAKAHLRLQAAAHQTGDPAAAVYASEISVFLMTLQRYGEKLPIGQRHAKMLGDMIAAQNTTTDMFTAHSSSPSLPGLSSSVETDTSPGSDFTFAGVLADQEGAGAKITELDFDALLQAIST